MSDSQRLEPSETVSATLEVYKQLITLAASSIVLIGTFLKDIFPTESGTLDVGWLIKLCIAAAFVLFGLSLIVAAWFMTYYSFFLERSGAPHRDVFTWQWGRALPLAFFVLGTISFGAAVLMNLYR